MNVVIVRGRRKTLSVSVNRDAEVVVRAPLYIKDEEINRFIEKHQSWIRSRLALIEKNKLNLADGACISLFGREYTLACGRAAVKSGFVYLPKEDREKALIGLLKSFVKKEMKERTAKIAEENGFCYATVRISSARGRWGSCSKKGNISYSFRVAFLPSDIVDYIVVHELCHTRHFNHGVKFWQEVERIIHDYKLRRKRLKEHSNIMNWL
ncbi:MAG: M48 family metallopeptidase [Clostridia bacterium]|nr:M48 family metallopeptidase [Clostridia bacterium]